MNSQIYRYSNFNWVIETQYGQLDLLNNFLDSNKGVSYNKGLSTSKNSSQYWFLGKGADYSMNESFTKITKSISKIISNKLNEYNLIDKGIFLKPESSWTVVGSKGSFHKVHDHGGNFGLCSIIYTKVPELVDDEDHEGYVYFIMSSDIRSNVYAAIPKVIDFKPELGKMLIFPSHMLHGVYPYADGVRQSFNLDYSVIPLDVMQRNNQHKYQYD